MSRRGRRKLKDIERHADGQITRKAREEDVRKPVRAARRRHLGVRKGEDLDPALEGVTGRLWLAGRLSDDQFYLARSLANAVRGFVEVAGAPKLVPKISSIYPVVSHAGIPEDIAELIAQHTSRFMFALANLEPGVKQLVWIVVIEERDVTLSEHEIAQLAAGLDGVIDYLRSKSKD